MRPGSRVPYVPTAAFLVRREAPRRRRRLRRGHALRRGRRPGVAAGGAGLDRAIQPGAVVRYPARPGLRAWLRQRVADYGSSAVPAVRQAPSPADGVGLERGGLGPGGGRTGGRRSAGRRQHCGARPEAGHPAPPVREGRAAGGLGTCTRAAKRPTPRGGPGSRWPDAGAAPPSLPALPAALVYPPWSSTSNAGPRLDSCAGAGSAWPTISRTVPGPGRLARGPYDGCPAPGLLRRFHTEGHEPSTAPGQPRPSAAGRKLAALTRGDGGRLPLHGAAAATVPCQPQARGTRGSSSSTRRRGCRPRPPARRRYSATTSRTSAG